MPIPIEFLNYDISKDEDARFKDLRVSLESQFKNELVKVYKELEILKDHIKQHCCKGVGIPATKIDNGLDKKD